MNMTYRIRLLTGFVITWATRRVPHVEHDLLTLLEHLRSPPSFWWGSGCLFFSFLCGVMCTIVCLFVLFIFSHGVVSLFSIYEFDCPIGICRPLLKWSTPSPTSNYHKREVLDEWKADAKIYGWKKTVRNVLTFSYGWSNSSAWIKWHC